MILRFNKPLLLQFEKNELLKRSNMENGYLKFKSFQTLVLLIKPDVISWNEYFNNDFTFYQTFAASIWKKWVSQKIKYVVQNRHKREREWLTKEVQVFAKERTRGSKNQRWQSQCKIFWWFFFCHGDQLFNEEYFE